MRLRSAIPGVALALGACLAVPLQAAESPVAYAAMRVDTGAIQSLLQQKADVNAAQADGATAI